MDALGGSNSTGRQGAAAGRCVGEHHCSVAELSGRTEEMERGWGVRALECLVQEGLARSRMARPEMNWLETSSTCRGWKLGWRHREAPGGSVTLLAVVWPQREGFRIIGLAAGVAGAQAAGKEGQGKQ